MAKTTLDRISMGSFENTYDKKVLDNRGKVTFKLHVHTNEGPYWSGDRYFDHYFIIGKLSKGEVVFDQSIASRKLIDKQEFLQEVNEDLSQIDCYLAEAKYSKKFPAFWMHKVKGVLYKETEKKEEGGK